MRTARETHPARGGARRTVSLTAIVAALVLVQALVLVVSRAFLHW